MLSLQYNRQQPVIFNTYQAYLKDSYTRLMEDIERARREGYTFAAKLVGHTCIETPYAYLVEALLYPLNLACFCLALVPFLVPK